MVFVRQKQLCLLLASWQLWSYVTRSSKPSCHVHSACMQAVREAVSIPVLANGNIRNLQDVHDCMAYTGVEGVMSAESLLEDPALFWPHRLTAGGTLPHLLFSMPKYQRHYLSVVSI